MKTKMYVLVMISFILTGKSFGQEPHQIFPRYTGITLGMDFAEMKETSLNRAIHKGPGVYFGLFTEKQRGRTIQRLEFLVSSHFMKSAYEKETSTFNFSGQLRYRYLINISDPHVSPGVYIGGSASVNTQINYFDTWDENHFFWLTSYSIGLDSRIERRLGKNKLQIEAGLPLLSLASRPPVEFTESQFSSDFSAVAKKLHENPRIVSPFRHFSGYVSVRYCFDENARIRKNVLWQTHYLHNELPGSGKLKSLTHRLGLELYF
jgi:hypothetical protein